MNLEKKFEEVKSYIGEMENLNHAITLVDWDMRTNMPVKAGESRSRVIEYLSGESFKMATSPRIKEFILYICVPADICKYVLLSMVGIKISAYIVVLRKHF